MEAAAIVKDIRQELCLELHWSREGREIGDESKKIPKSLEMLGHTACFKDFGFSSA